jgi:hypothetical protein
MGNYELGSPSSRKLRNRDRVLAPDIPVARVSDSPVIGVLENKLVTPGGTALSYVYFGVKPGYITLYLSTSR